MAKKKRRQSRNRESTIKTTIKYELAGLILLALSVISMAGLGAVGKTIVLFFRFWLGEWYMAGLVGLFILSIYLIWKRQIPFFLHGRLVGAYSILAALLILSHVTLF